MPLFGIAFIIVYMISLMVFYRNGLSFTVLIVGSKKIDLVKCKTLRLVGGFFGRNLIQ